MLQCEKDALLAKLPTPTTPPARARKNRKKKADITASHEKVTLAFELPVTHVNTLYAALGEVQHRKHIDACMVRCDHYVHM